MEKGFFSSLFDLSFSSFVTPKLIKILFILLLVGLGFIYVIFGVSIASQDSTGGVLWFLLLGPLVVFIYVLVYRVLLELIMVIFRIYENSRDQVALLREVHPEASARIPKTGIIGPQGQQGQSPVGE
jgi:hypothetical protein